MSATFLIVDDESGVRSALSGVLRDEGYRVEAVDSGEACQFSLADGSLQSVWRTDKSPRVTCPQLVEIGGQIRLVLTTAD